MQFLSLPNSLHNSNISVNGEQYLKQALNKKRGVLLISGHFGLWELLLGWFGINKYPLLLTLKNSFSIPLFITKLLKNPLSFNLLSLFFNNSLAIKSWTG